MPEAVIMHKTVFTITGEAMTVNIKASMSLEFKIKMAKETNSIDRMETKIIIKSISLFLTYCDNLCTLNKR